MHESAYQGSFEESSTLFKRHGLTEIDMLVNGVSVHGMPIKMTDDCVAVPYTRFLNLTKSFMGKSLSEIMNIQEYHDYHFLQVATFAETTGALSFEFSFSSTVPTGLILVTCSIFDINMELDNFGNFKQN